MRIAQDRLDDIRRQKAGFGRPGAGGPFDPFLGKPLLHLVPELLIDYGIMQTGIALVLVHDLAAIEAVLQHQIERAAIFSNRTALLLWPSGVNSPRESLTSSDQPTQGQLI